MWMRVISRHLWELGIFLQALLTITLLVKRSSRKFPFFAAYSFFCFVKSSVMYVLVFYKRQSISLEHWMQGYWIAEVVGIILGFGVIYEVFRKLLNSYSALHALANAVFKWAFVVLTVLGFVVLYVQLSPGHAPDAGAMYLVEEAVRTTEVGLLLFLFLFAGAFGLHWRQSIFGIALGFGLFISIELMALTLRSYLPESFNIVRSIAFNTSLLLWLGYLLIPESATQDRDMPKLAQLEQWNQALMELIHQ